MPPMPNMLPNQPGPMPGVAGAQFMQHGFDDESSSFMPQLPMTNPIDNGNARKSVMECHGGNVGNR